MTEPVSTLSQSAAADPLLADLFEDIANKLQGGEPVDMAAYLRQYPEHAERLRRLLPTVHVLADLGRSATGGEAALGPAALAGPGPGVLGDFQIRREVGRGGMGIVYEAEQLSLKRRVALKVLTFASVLDPRQLQRFTLEAQAAAHLEHPNIVPVFAVGCSQGVHYYAMQFIEGQTLEGLIRQARRRSGLDPETPPLSAPGGEATIDLLAESPTPGRDARLAPALAALSASERPMRVPENSIANPAYYRTVARLGIQAAEALDHAHQRGVVHRDIKPANLLLDRGGRVWVTDFGLAHFQSDARLTMSGDVLGTLRYMSPEQALARRGMVDQRTDIYALGVTLYELLTLVPAFTGADRQEVLMQIAFGEARRPRRLNPALPTDLETIVLKAMARNSEERYGTAQELADDLQRYLEDRPILARAPSLGQRVVKWSRRHQALVTASAGLFLMAVAALAVATGLIWQERQEAIRQANLKEEQRQEALLQSQLKEEQRRAAQKQRQRAEQNLWQALYALEDRVQTLDQLGRGAIPPNEVRASLFRLMTFFRDFALENENEPTARGLAALAYRRLGDIEVKLQEPAEAEKAYLHAIVLLEKTLADFATQPAYRQDLVASMPLVGTAVSRPGPNPRATSPAATLSAEQGEAQIEAKYRKDLAVAYRDLGTFLLARDQPTQAVPALRKVLEIQELLGRKWGAPSVYQKDLAENSLYLGIGLARTEQFAEAEPTLRRVLDQGAKLPSALQGIEWNRRRLAAAHHQLGRVYQATKRFPEATAAYRQSLKLLDGLPAPAPGGPSYSLDRQRVAADLDALLGKEKKK